MRRGDRSRTAIDPVNSDARPAAISFGNATQKLLAAEDRIFTSQRLATYGIAAFAGLTIISFWALGGWAWLIPGDGRLPNIDFCWIWFSGKFVAAGHASTIYHPAQYEAAYRNYYHPGQCQLLLRQYVYPPTFLFLTCLLGLLPYAAAFAAWVGGTLLLYLAAMYLVLPGWTTVVLALTPFAALFNMMIGHNGFLTAGLLGLSLIFLERRPSLAGVLLGLLSYKPQFGVLFPLALLASRNWRAFAAAAATSLLFATAAAFCFGLASWPAFIASLLDRNPSLSPQANAPLLLDSLYGLFYWAGAGPRPAAAAQLVVSASLAVTVCVVWAGPVRYPLKAATLCVAALFASPYALPYDLCILSIAVAFLAKDMLSRGFLAGERVSILLGFILLYLPSVPLGAAVYAILLILIFRRMALSDSGEATLSGRGSRAAGAPPSP